MKDRKFMRRAMRNRAIIDSALAEEMIPEIPENPEEERAQLIAENRGKFIVEDGNMPFFYSIAETRTDAETLADDIRENGGIPFITAI